MADPWALALSSEVGVAVVPCPKPKVVRRPRKRPAASALLDAAHVSSAIVCARPSPPLSTGHMVAQVLFESRNLVVNASNADSSTMGFLKGLLTKSSARMGTKVMLASQFGLSRHDIGPLTVVAANILVSLDRANRFQLENSFVAHIDASRLHCYIDCDTSDETPMPVASNCGKRFLKDIVTPMAAPDQGNTVAVAHQTHVTTGSSAKRSKLTSKLLQSEGSFGILIELPSGELVSTVGRTLNWIQMLDRTTAECLFAAHSLRSAVRLDVAGKFATRTRIACEDRAKSNARCGRGIMHDREGWKHIGIDCEIHISAGIHKKTFALVDATISGQINFALSVNFGTGVGKFQQLLKDVVYSRVVVVHDPPPREADRYRKQLLTLCCRSGSRLVEKRISLCTLPNGDIRKRDVVEVYIPRGVQYDLDTVKEVVSSGCADVLSGVKFFVYQRNRWFGCDKAFDEYSLLEGFCGLGSLTFERFCAVMSCASSGAASTTHAPSAFVVGETALVPSDDPSLQISASTTKEDASQFRARGLNFTRADSLGIVLVVRQVMEPIQRLMKQQLASSGAQAERNRLVANMKLVGDGGPLSDVQDELLVPIVIAASHQLEDAFLKQWHLLMFHSALWEDLLPARFHTHTMRHLAFRLLSRVEGMVETELRSRHDVCPIRFFRALLSDDEAKLIEGLPECLLCEWSRGILLQHRHEATLLRGRVCQAKLRLHAKLARMNISRLESLHASLRRQLWTKGVQTHAADFAESAAEFTIDRSRNSEFHFEFEQPRLSSTPVVSDVFGGSSCSGAVVPEALSGGGGAWRSFVWKHTYGQSGRPDFAALAERYHALSDAEWSVYEREGGEACAAHRAGADRPFGLQAREVQRAQDILVAKSQLSTSSSVVIAQPHGKGGRGDVAAVATNALQAGAGVPLHMIVKSAKRELRIVNRTCRAAFDRDHGQLIEWIASKTPAFLDKLCRVIPNSGVLRSMLKALPQPDEIALQYISDKQNLVHVVDRIFSTNRLSHLRSSLQSSWGEKCAPIMHAPQPAINASPVPNSSKKPACSVVGICLCSEAGCNVWQMRVNFMKGMKPHFKHGLKSRDSLVAGFVVAELHGWRPHVEDPWGAALCDELGSDASGSDTLTYWHVCFQSLSPFRSCFRRMVRSCGQNGVPGAHVLEALILYIYIYTWGQGGATWLIGQCPDLV
jgi:hypothetical protein